MEPTVVLPQRPVERGSTLSQTGRVVEARRPVLKARVSAPGCSRMPEWSARSDEPWDRRSAVDACLVRLSGHQIAWNVCWSGDLFEIVGWRCLEDDSSVVGHLLLYWVECHMFCVIWCNQPASVTWTYIIPMCFFFWLWHYRIHIVVFCIISLVFSSVNKENFIFENLYIAWIFQNSHTVTTIVTSDFKPAVEIWP